MVVTAGFLLYADADAMSETASDDGMPKLVAPPSQMPPARRQAPRISAQKLAATGKQGFQSAIQYMCAIERELNIFF